MVILVDMDDVLEQLVEAIVKYNNMHYGTDVRSYDVVEWNLARAFDAALVKYYSGSYTLETVDELNPAVPAGYDKWDQLFVTTHYGDWPSPEVFFINEATGSGNSGNGNGGAGG